MQPFARIGQSLSNISEGRYWPQLLLLPSLLIILVVILYPAFDGILLSFREMRLTRPDLGTGFVGGRHYSEMFADPSFWTALKNTFVWVFFACSVELVLGLISALALNRDTVMAKVLAVIVLLPWFLPNVVAANIWALILDARLGVGNEILIWLGILEGQKAWFADPDTAMMAAIFVEAWHSYPFFTLLLLAGLKAIPQDLYKAAAVDGANAWKSFKNITLPMLKLIIMTAVILRVISLTNSPEMLLILTNGGPGDATQVLSLYAYKTAYETFDFGYAGALSVATLTLLMFFCVFYLRISKAAES